MKKAIKIEVEKATENQDPSASKFFGSPVVPIEWDGDFYEDEIFFFQIRLKDIAKYDKENRLPHVGFLYVFLYTAEGDYSLQADVRYYKGEPTLVINDFNSVVGGYEKFNQAYLMKFSEADDEEDCTRLFGVPSDWNYQDEAPNLLMQFDPLSSEMGFLDFIDGFLYFFFGKNLKNLEEVFLHEEFS